MANSQLATSRRWAPRRVHRVPSQISKMVQSIVEEAISYQSLPAKSSQFSLGGPTIPAPIPHVIRIVEWRIYYEG